MLSDAQSSVPIIFLVTDGTVEDEREICDVIKNHVTNGESMSPRIYTVGIGMISSFQYFKSGFIIMSYPIKIHRFLCFFCVL